MSENWYQLYTEIADLIANHSEIKIEPSIVRIGETVRTEFYQLFWAAGEAFLIETNKVLIDEAEVLSKNYLQVEEEVIKLLGLEHISLFPRVGKFLHNPKDELIKELRNPFFDLLKGRIDIARYQQEASNALVSSFDTLYQQGYEIWMVLSLIKLLEADKTFRVDADQFDDDELFRHGGEIEVPVHKPEELREISFKHNPTIGILVADQIVHSARNGQYFSFRSNIVEPEGVATNKSKRREWFSLPVETIINMGSNVIFVYIDKELDELSLIADSKIVCIPDLIIECVGLQTLHSDSDLIKTRKYTEDFKPKLGMYIVSNQLVIEEKPIEEGAEIMADQALIEEKSEEKEADVISDEPVTKKVLDDREPDIHFLPIGFDQSKLEQIINLFTNK